MAKANPNGQGKGDTTGNKKIRNNLRTQKVKTDAQKAAAAENQKIAAARLAKLKEVQQQAAELRKTYGYVGSDGDVLALHQRAMDAQKEQTVVKWIDTVLNQTGKSGKVIRKWLDRRINLPAYDLKVLILNFLARPCNEWMKEEVNGMLERIQSVKSA